jgi:activator of HSP90 ATPase
MAGVRSEVGKTADSGWQLGVSETVPYPATDLWEFLLGREGIEIWLGPGVELPKERGAAYETANGTAGHVRSFRELDKVRLTWRPKDWDHDSTLQLTVSGAGAKSTLRFQQELLADAEERELQRSYWEDVTERLVAALAERTPAL